MAHKFIEDFRSRCRAYCNARGIKTSTLGAYALKDRDFIARLEKSEPRFIRSMKRIDEYMQANPVDEPPRLGCKCACTCREQGAE